jgi:hypothetical protein
MMRLLENNQARTRIGADQILEPAVEAQIRHPWNPLIFLSKANALLRFAWAAA